MLARALNKGHFCVTTCKMEQGHVFACFLIAKAGFSHQLSWNLSFSILFASFPYSEAHYLILNSQIFTTIVFQRGVCCLLPLVSQHVRLPMKPGGGSVAAASSHLGRSTYLSRMFHWKQPSSWKSRCWLVPCGSGIMSLTVVLNLVHLHPSAS